MAWGRKQQKIEALEAEVSELKGALPYAEDAKAINEEVAKILANGDMFALSEVALRAIDLVRRRKHAEVYDRLALEYAVKYDAEILNTLVAELRASSEDEIRTQVRNLYDIDPDIHASLHRQARDSLWQEATDELAKEIKETERVDIEQQVERQRIYNHATTRFQYNGVLALNDDELIKTFEKGDMLVLRPKFFSPAMQPVVYSFQSTDESAPLWQYVSGYVQGNTYGDKDIANADILYRLGSIPSSKYGNDTQYDTILRSRPMVAVFSLLDNSGAYTKVMDEIQFDSNNLDNFVDTAVLMTPLAYEQHLAQTQN